MTETTSAEGPGPGAAPGKHHHDVPRTNLVGIPRPTFFLVVFGLLLALGGQYAATRYNAHLVSDATYCVLAQLGEHRINSSSFNEEAAEAGGFNYERNVDVDVPSAEDVDVAAARCLRFLPTSASDQERGTRDIGGG